LHFHTFSLFFLLWKHSFQCWTFLFEVLPSSSSCLNFGTIFTLITENRLIKNNIRLIKCNNLSFFRLNSFSTIFNKCTIIKISCCIHLCIPHRFIFINIDQIDLILILFIRVYLCICILYTIIILNYINLKKLWKYFYGFNCIILILSNIMLFC
jgi:hypothetical protein